MDSTHPICKGQALNPQVVAALLKRIGEKHHIALAGDEAVPPQDRDVGFYMIVFYMIVSDSVSLIDRGQLSIKVLEATALQFVIESAAKAQHA